MDVHLKHESHNFMFPFSEKDPKKRISWTNIKLAVCDVFQAQDKDQPTFERFLFKMMIFGCFMFYFWLTDYLHIW